MTEKYKDLTEGSDMLRFVVRATVKPQDGVADAQVQRSP